MINLKTGFNQRPSVSIGRWLGSMDILTIAYHVIVAGIYPPYPGMGDDAFRLYVILAAIREMTAE
jgi:hypothetical protein